MFQAGVTVWYKYLDTAGNKVLEFPVRGESATKRDTTHDTAFWVGYWVGTFAGGLIAGVLCGSMPLCFGIRRGRLKLASAAMASCAAAGLVLGLLLAIPSSLVFTIVIFAIPRVVPDSIVLPVEMLD
jgi:hypothetical protein